MKTCLLLQALLDSTPICRDVIEWCVMPFCGPDPRVAKSKMKHVLKQLVPLNLECAYCEQWKISTLLTDPRGKWQPKHRVKWFLTDFSTRMPFCKDCVPEHQKEFRKWKMRGEKCFPGDKFYRYVYSYSEWYSRDTRMLLSYPWLHVVPLPDPYY